MGEGEHVSFGYPNALARFCHLLRLEWLLRALNRLVSHLWFLPHLQCEVTRYQPWALLWREEVAFPAQINLGILSCTENKEIPHL